MVARDPAEGVRQVWIATAVVERVARLVQERLVVVQPALRARDQVHDARWIACDHARARRLLRTVVEVEVDVRRGAQVEAELFERADADLGRAFLRVCRLEGREPAHVRRVEARRDLVALVAEQPLEPARAESRERSCRLVARRVEREREPAERDPFLLRVTLDRVADLRVVGGQLFAGTDERERVVVEARHRLGLDLSERLAVAVVGQHGEPRLRISQRHLLALEGDALGEDAVLELVLALRELGRDETPLAGLAQAVQQLTVVARGGVLRLAQRIELVAAEEVLVAADDLRLLRDLLLADANGPRLFGALEQVRLKALFELRRRPNSDYAHAATLADDQLPGGCDECLGGVRLREHRGRACPVFAGVRRAGDEHDRDAVAEDLIEQLVALLAAEMDVEKDDVGSFLPER